MTLPLDTRTAAYWPLDEQHDSLLPSDASGHLGDLTVPAGLTRPTVVDGTISGFGRDYVRAALSGLVVTDTTGATRLTRGLTIAAIARLDIEVLSAGDRCVIVQRGRGGGADPMSFRLAVEVHNVPSRQVKLLLFWQTEAGADVFDPGVLFHWPPGEHLLLAATREVIAGSLAVRYQINGESFAGGQAYALNCGGAVSADVSLGVAMTGAVTLGSMDGVLDSVQILDEAVSPEEFSWLWYRLAVAQAEGVQTMRQLVPPGVYSTDPDSRIQRELAVEGMAIGHAKALARRLRYFHLPDVAFGDAFDRWEQLTGYAPKPGDHLQIRRDRVLSFLGTVRGFSIQDVQAQLAERFATDVVQILEYGNDYSQDFAADTGSGLSIAGNGTITFTGGELAMAATSADLSYGGLVTPRAPHVLWPLAHGDDAWLQCKVRSVTPTTGACVAGLMIGRRDLDEWIVVGMLQTGGIPLNTLSWLRYRAGVLDGAATTLATFDATPMYLWVHHVAAGTFAIGHGTTLDLAKAATPIALVTGHASPLWAGLAVVAPTTSSASPSVAFDEFFARTPNGHQRFNWYAYRDPALPGTPDMIGAREVVRRIKPAHSSASACTTLAVTCDDAGNGCDQTPIGL
jgi:hypothetical protein